MIDYEQDDADASRRQGHSQSQLQTKENKKSQSPTELRQRINIAHSKDSTLVPGPPLLLLASPMPLADSNAAMSGSPVKSLGRGGRAARCTGSARSAQATQALGPALSQLH